MESSRPIPASNQALWHRPSLRNGSTAFAMLLAIAFTLCGCGAQHQANNALEDAKRLAAKGDYEAALEKHVWFHDHVLEIDRSYYGVRLSFALMDWVALGQKHPKALATLKGIRDDKAARLLAGEKNPELFHDVEAINSCLKEPGSTVDIFKKIDAINAELAAALYPWAEESLVGAREFALARKHLGDPVARLEEARSTYQPGSLQFQSLPAGHPQRTAFEGIFAEQVVHIIKVLEGVGELAAAKDIQNRALRIVNSPAIQNALAP